jgi:uncharacterized protein (DUF2147 family)
MLKRMPAMLGAATMALAQQAGAATIDGLWRPPPRADGAWITVRIGPCPENPRQRCGHVAGAYDGAPPKIVGVEVVIGLERQEDGSWAEGRIDRQVEGTFYRSRLTLLGDDTVRVVGCVLLGGLNCEEQLWTRIE